LRDLGSTPALRSRPGWHNSARRNRQIGDSWAATVADTVISRSRASADTLASGRTAPSSTACGHVGSGMILSSGTGLVSGDLEPAHEDVLDPEHQRVPSAAGGKACERTRAGRQGPLTRPRAGNRQSRRSRRPGMSICADPCSISLVSTGLTCADSVASLPVGGRRGSPRAAPPTFRRSPPPRARTATATSSRQSVADPSTH
jgi:hypothetical protein